MKKLITTLVAGAMAIAMSVGSADASKKGTPTCKEGDKLVKLADGGLRCWAKDKSLPEGAVEQKAAATAPAAKPAAGAPTSTLAKFAEAAEACLKEAGALSEAPGQPGGFVGGDGRLHFTSPNDELAAKCAAAGNAGGRPARWK